MFLSGELSENPAPAIAVLAIGIIAVATSRWKNDYHNGYLVVSTGNNPPYLV
jgi:hypothetical protein